MTSHKGRVTEPEAPKIGGVRHRFSLCDVRHGRRPSLMAQRRSANGGQIMAAQITNRSPLTQALKSCYPALGATFVLSMFINATMLASPLYSMQVYDRVLTSRNVSTLVMLTLIVGVFLVLYGVLEFTRSGVLARAGVQFESF